MNKCVLCDRKVKKAHPEMIRKDIAVCDNCSIPSSWIEQKWATCNCPTCSPTVEQRTFNPLKKEV